MANVRSDSGLSPALRLFDGGSVAGMSEGELLERFASRRDEAAFTALVALHGPMVLATCRGVLRDMNDAEDAFQATFLVLVKKAGVLRVIDSLGGWLYRVAFRMALQANEDAARRRERERRAGEESALRRSDCGEREEAVQRLYAEIDRLPDRYRLPLVLCHLEGLTQDVAARRLGLSEGTLRRRLEQARDRLRVRLRRGSESQNADAGLALLPRQAAVPVAWAEEAVRVAVSVAPGRSKLLAAAWAETMLRSMSVARFLRAGTMACALALTGTSLAIMIGVVRGERPERATRTGQGGGHIAAGASDVAKRMSLPRFDGPLAPLGNRVYVSGTSWLADAAPQDRWVSLAIDAEGGAARREGWVYDRASIWRSADGSILGWSGIGSRDGSLWARAERSLPRRVFDARNLGQSCSGLICAFAPDGKQVVVATLVLREGRRVFTTWRMNADGTERIRLPLEDHEMVADWSPDGEQLLVVSLGHSPTVGPPSADTISVSNPDGGNRRLLRKGCMFIYPSFAPNGGRIAYIGCDPRDGRHALMVIDPDGSNPHRVLDLRGVVIGRICWSPDGTRLALSRLTSPGEVRGPQLARVEIVNLAGTDRRELELPVAFTEITELSWR